MKQVRHLAYMKGFVKEKNTQSQQTTKIQVLYHT